MATSGSRHSTRHFKQVKEQFYRRCKRERPACWLCGQPIDYDADPGSTDDSLTLDHRIPVSKRPDLQDDPANFMPAHRSCNIRRGDADPVVPLGQLSRDWCGASRGEGR